MPTTGIYQQNKIILLVAVLQAHLSVESQSREMLDFCSKHNIVYDIELILIDKVN
jgi:D-arabinose 1-dehydrogenase-like Zn-dependent alcohol dehydrogenase